MSTRLWIDATLSPAEAGKSSSWSWVKEPAAAVSLLESGDVLSISLRYKTDTCNAVLSWLESHPRGAPQHCIWIHFKDAEKDAGIPALMKRILNIEKTARAAVTE